MYPRDMISGTRWRRADFRLPLRHELSRDGHGATRSAELGAPIWFADFETVQLPVLAAEGLHAQFEALQHKAKTFFAWPVRRPKPAASDGSGLGGVTLSSIDDDGLSLSLAGLPTGLELKAGDFLGIQSASGREFHKLEVGGVAGVGGDVAGLVPTYGVRPSVEPGQAVSLAPPMVEMQLEPESLSFASVNKINARVSFRAFQVVTS